MSGADACIAGVCLAHLATLANRDTRGFEGIGLAEVAVTPRQRPDDGAVRSLLSSRSHRWLDDSQPGDWGRSTLAEDPVDHCEGVVGV